MVQSLTAATSQDTRGVGLEGGLVGLDSNGDGLLGHRRHEGVHVAGLDVGEGGGSSARHLRAGALAGSAGSRARSVCESMRRERGKEQRRTGVVSLSAESSVALDPGKGIIHPSTVAAKIDVITSNQLLFGQRDGLSVLHPVSAFQSASGGERPAGAAASLVLDRGHGTSGRPVNRSWQAHGVGGSLVEVGSALAESWWANTTQMDGIVELRQRHVRELVQGHLVGQVLRVVGLNGIHVISKNLQSVNEFSTVLEGEAILHHVFGEGRFVEITRANVASKGSGSHGSNNKSLVHFI